MTLMIEGSHHAQNGVSHTLLKDAINHEQIRNEVNFRSEMHDELIAVLIEARTEDVSFA